MKRTLMLLISLSLSFGIVSTAVAEVPNNTIVINNNAFDMKYFGDEDNKEEVMKEINKEKKKVFFKIHNQWYDSSYNKVDKSLIPKLRYKSFSTTDEYEQHDGEVISKDTTADGKNKKDDGILGVGNGKEVVEYKGWIYYTENQKIFKIKEDLSEVRVLFENDSKENNSYTRKFISDMNLVGNHLYFTVKKNYTKESSIYRIGLDGGEKEVYFDYHKFLRDNYLSEYYGDYGRKNEKKKLEEVYFDEQCMYVLTDEHIVKKNLKSGSAEIFNYSAIDSLAIGKDYIYGYRNNGVYSSSLFRIKKDGSQLEKIVDLDLMFNFIDFKDDKLYYSIGNGNYNGEYGYYAPKESLEEFVEGKNILLFVDNGIIASDEFYTLDKHFENKRFFIEEALDKYSRCFDYVEDRYFSNGYERGYATVGDYIYILKNIGLYSKGEGWGSGDIRENKIMVQRVNYASLDSEIEVMSDVKVKLKPVYVNGNKAIVIQVLKGGKFNLPKSVMAKAVSIENKDGEIKELNNNSEFPVTVKWNVKDLKVDTSVLKNYKFEGIIQGGVNKNEKVILVVQVYQY